MTLNARITRPPQVTCVASNPYYKESTSASYEFTMEPVDETKEEKESSGDFLFSSFFRLTFFDLLQF